ncbi:toll-like receptor 4 [Gigantopelta aegis]|uniref:toll-like receptor 4 n=1 Tax=Gigantopelta aegis TaxID=1735272 RepID=UPI001B888A0B|nr:toll-like receptor 4 [Gigantopelta aegis]
MLIAAVIIILSFVMNGLCNTTSCPCDFHDTVANCSYKNFTKVPNCIPDNITVLFFVNNTLTEIDNETFSSWPNLTYIDVTNNSIINISQDAYSSLTFLETLILNNNVMGVDTIKSAFKSLNQGHLKYLGLTNVMTNREMKDDFFYNLNESGITHLKLMWNNIERFNMSVFRIFKHLKNVDLSYNFISVLNLAPDIQIQTLTVNNNKVSIINGHNHSYEMRYLTKLHLKHNDIVYLKQHFFRFFPNIEMVDLSESPASVIYKNAFSSLQNLTIIKLDNMCGLRRIEENAFNNRHVKYISLKNNYLDFSKEEHYSHNMFNGCTNLVQLNLSGNLMMDANSAYLTNLFKPVNRTIKTIFLDHCILRILPETFSLFPALTHLYLIGNELASISHSYFPPTLRLLNVKDNEITTVNESSIPANLTNLKINLALNQFDCTCDLMWFVNLLEATNSSNTFYQHSESYTCSSPRPEYKKSLRRFAKTISEQKCLLASSTILMIIAALTFLFILIIVGTLLYHYRWHFRYFLYMLRSSRLAREADDDCEYVFDAFVAYSPKDLKWILEQAIPNLEESEHFQLCIHQRDFQLGGLLVDDILQCINSSKKFIILLSDKFARSQWCQFVLAVIQRQLRTQCRDILIVVKLGKIDTKHLSPSMFDLLTTKNYMEWSEDLRARPSFWRGLVQYMKQRPNLIQSCSQPNPSRKVERPNVCERSLSEHPGTSRDICEDDPRYRCTV